LFILVRYISLSTKNYSLYLVMVGIRI